MDKEKLSNIADYLEQFMYERGEYDYGSDDVKWVQDIPALTAEQNEGREPTEAENELYMRLMVTARIENDLKQGHAADLIAYLESELSAMDKGDETREIAEALLPQLEELSKVNPLTLSQTAEELNAVDEKAHYTFTMDDKAALEQNFTLVPFYEYAEQYGGGYEISDDIADGVVGVGSYGDDDDRYQVTDDDRREAAQEVEHEIEHFIEKYEPLVAVDENGNAAIVPLFKKEDGSIITASQLEEEFKKEFSADTIELIAYGRTIDTDFYSPPETEEMNVDVSLEIDFEPYDAILKDVREQISELENIRDIEKASSHFYDIVSEGSYAVRRNEAGTFDVYDTDLGDYRATGLASAEQVIDSISHIIDEQIIGYLFEEYANFEGNPEERNAPQKAYEWEQFAARPENAAFAEAYADDIADLIFISDGNAMEKVDLGAVADRFFPDEKPQREPYSPTKEWHNHGDKNVIDEGSILLKRTEQAGVYDAIIIMPNPDNENTVFAGQLTIDTKDFGDDTRLHHFGKQAEELAKHGKYLADYDLQRMLVAQLEDTNLVELGAIAYGEAGAQAAYDISGKSFEVGKGELAKALKEQGVEIGKSGEEHIVSLEQSETLVDFLQNFNCELDKTDDGQFTIWNGDTNDYIKDENGEIRIMGDAEDVLEAMSSMVEAVAEDMGMQFSHSHELLGYQSTEEILKFAEAHPNDKFTQENQFAVSVMKMNGRDATADLDKAYEIQSARSEKAKEQEKEQPKDKQSKKFEGR